MSGPASTSPTELPHAATGTSSTIVDDDVAPAPPRAGLSRGELVGRYVILDRIGKGGMGVVYAAYDRDLDRRVALKLLHAGLRRDSRGSGRLLREAQALARLTHPNVVAVHEVGTYEGQLYIAMEFVDGQTLGEWLEAAPRPWREVVAMLEQAGRGLVEAHAQGMVHRDFKPDNVLVGHDGRARVVDFGLARVVDGSEELRSESSLDLQLEPPDSAKIRLTETGAAAGTPAYMAPEQHHRQEPDARTDQFAFCVTLWEALYGQRPFAGSTRFELALTVCRGELQDSPSRDVPAFLRRALRRGLATDRDQRFPSMDALLAAIDRDPSRARRRVLAGGLAALGIASLSALAARWSEAPADPCAGGESRLAAAWGETQRRAVTRAFGEIPAEFAAASLLTVTRELERYAEGWQRGYREACEATHVRHEQSAELLDRRMACLGQRLAALKSTTTLLGEADRSAVAHSIEAVTGLPALEECAATERLMSRVAPPSDPAAAAEVEQLRGRLTHASVLGLTGQADRGLRESRRVRERALALGYAPRAAAAALRVGTLGSSAGKPHEALQTLHEAVDEAIAAGHDAVLVAATTRLVSVIGVGLSRYDEAERWGRLAAAAVRRRGDQADDAIALGRTMCMMLADRGTPQDALPHCRRSLERSIERHGPEHAVTGLAHRAMGNAHYWAGDYEAASQEFERSIELFLRSHGPDHPEYPALLNSRAAVCYSRGDALSCLELFAETVEAAIRSHGPEHPAVADFSNNYAIILHAAGRLDEAEARAKASLALRRAAFGDGHPGVGAAHRVLANVALSRGDLDGARYHIDRAVTVLKATRGDRHPDVVHALSLRAEIRLADGDASGALPDLERAVELADALERPGSELAQLRFDLARALWEHRADDRDRARAIATRAHAQAGDEPLAGEIGAWLDDPGGA